MQLLALTNYTATSVDAVKRLSGPTQSRFNRVFAARAAHVRLEAFLAVECGAYAATGLAKGVVACMTSRTTFAEARVHLTRAARLAIALLFTPLVGLANPQSTVDLLQRLSLLPASTWSLPSALRALRNTALVSGALAIAGYAIHNRFFAKVVETGSSFFAIWAAGSAVSVLAAAGTDAGMRYQYRPVLSREVIQRHNSFLRNVSSHPLVKVENHPDGGIVVKKHWDQGHCVSHWTKDDVNGVLPMFGHVDHFVVTSDGQIVMASGTHLKICDQQGKVSQLTFAYKITCLSRWGDDGAVAVGLENGSNWVGKPEKLEFAPLAPMQKPVEGIWPLGKNGTIFWQEGKLYVLVPNKLIVDFDASSVECLEASPTGQRFAVSTEATLRIIDRISKTEQSIDTQGRIVTAIKWLPGKLLIGDNEGVFRILDVSGGCEIYSAKMHSDRIYDISVQGRTVVTSSNDGTHCRWVLNPRVFG